MGRPLIRRLWSQGLPIAEIALRCKTTPEEVYRRMNIARPQFGIAKPKRAKRPRCPTCGRTSTEDQCRVCHPPKPVALKPSQADLPELAGIDGLIGEYLERYLEVRSRRLAGKPMLTQDHKKHK